MRVYEDLAAMDVDFVEADGKYFQQKVDRGIVTMEEI